MVLTQSRKLELYNAETGSLRKTFDVRGTTQPRNLDVQGNASSPSRESQPPSARSAAARVRA